MKKQNKNTIIFSVVLIVGLSIGAALFFDYWKENRAVTIDENYCNQYQPDFCPDGCIVCPPCLECSSIQCRLASSCETIGFDKNWYRQTKPSSATPSSNDKLKSNINTFMESQVSQNALGKENYHCSNLLYGYDEKYAYAWVLCSGFIVKSSGELEQGTGFSSPTRLEYKQPDFQIIAYEQPKDGSFYDTTLQQLFPKKFYDLAQPSNAEISELEKEVWDKAKQNDCLKQSGYCAQECNENDGVVYLKGCPSGQVCCMPKESYVGCKDLCGDGICQEIVCLAIDCPCAETVGSCPQDCK